MSAAMHLDFRRDEKLGCLTVWCKHQWIWAIVSDTGKCAGCGASLSHRIKAA